MSFSNNYFILISVIVLCLSNVKSISQKPILIIVSYDAFRYNYFDKNVTPHMDRLRKAGVTTDYMRNVFTSKTYPNHHTIATGLYPEVHGVVGNTMYDPLTNHVISYSYEMFHYNEEIIPLWTQNQQAGQGRHSGVMMWPGSSYAYKNINATFMQPWDPKIPWETRIDTVISWLTDSKTPANLVMIYFEEPDTLGHAYGPESDTIVNMISKLDNISHYLDQQLIKNKLHSKANVIHLSDHGMDSVSPPNFIDLTQFLTPNTYQMVETSPCVHVIPNKGKFDEVYKKLKDAAKINGHFKIFKKEEMPDKWHFKNNRRTPPILALADVGYGFQDLAESAKAYEKELGIKIKPTNKYGVHGYEPEVPSMRPFFMARGPAFKKGVTVHPFDTLDLYSLFCNVLNLTPNKNNGTFSHVAVMLSVDAAKDNPISPLIVAVGGGIFSLFFLGCIGSAVIWMMKCKKDSEGIPRGTRRYANIINTSRINIESQQLLSSDSE